MDIEILKAEQKDRPVIENLIRYYIYDFSEFAGWDCPESGLFGGCDDSPQYWGEQPHDPQYAWPEGWRGWAFVIRVDGKLAGFACVRQTNQEPPTYDVADFFILRKFRSKGVGKYVAHWLFDKFRGDWEIGEMMCNTPAQGFWRKVISDYTSGDYTESPKLLEVYGIELSVQYFSNAETHPPTEGR